MKYFVYILKSKVKDIHYIGSTNDVPTRVEVHNSSRARWTKR